jgi:hypothetical protein
VPWPTPSLPKVRTPDTALRRLQFDRGIDFFACQFSGQELPTPDLGESLDAGNVPSNRHLAVPDVIGFRFEMPIVLWPSIVDESGVEVGPERALVRI